MNRLLLFMACVAVVLASPAAYSQETTKSSENAIAELSKKSFHYSTINGKPSLVLTTEPEADRYNTDFNAPCDNTIVELGSTIEAVPVPETSLILAFLDCPASRGFQYDSIVAFFDKNNTDVPLCFSHLDLMPEYVDNTDYLYGHIERVEARSAADKALHVVVTLSGADGEDCWTTFAFLRVDPDCKVTVLTKLHSGSCHGDEGSQMSYRFLDNDTVEVTEEVFAPENQNSRKGSEISHKRYSLRELYRNHFR